VVIILLFNRTAIGLDKVVETVLQKDKPMVEYRLESISISIEECGSLFGKF